VPINTKSMIADAFLQLSQKKSLDKITIKDIVEQCGISRQAFYYHFEDIIGVIQWCIEIRMQQDFQRSLELEDPREAILLMITGVLDNRESIRRLYASQHKEQIEQIVIQTFCSLLKEIRTKRLRRKSYPTINADTTLRFLAYGLSGIVKDAVQSGDCDAEFLSDEIYALINSGLKI